MDAHLEVAVRQLVDGFNQIPYGFERNAAQEQCKAGPNHGAEHGQQGNGAPELGDGNISLVENPPVQVHQKSLQGHDSEHD